MKQNRRRGFTLVELLVVIAILAVLATVSIIGYSSFIKKANISNDQVVLEQMNMALISNEALSNKATYCDKAVEQCIEAGYILENLTPSAAGYYFAYDQKNNRFLLLDEELVYFFGDDNHSTSNYFIYVVVGKDSELKKANTNGYSTYLREGFEYNDENNTINTSKGIDVGKNVDCKKIEYVNDVAEQDVVIRTNNFDTVVSVNGALDTITHYGQAFSIDIMAVADHSYDEKGEVKGNIIVTAGHLDLSEVEGTYFVIVKDKNVKVTRNDDTVVIVAGEDNSITVEIDGVNVSKENTPDKVYYLNDMTPAQISNTLALATKFAGVGTEELPFLLQDGDDYQTLAKETGDLSGYQFKQTQDITITEDLSLDPSNKIKIDLNGKKLEITKDSKIGDKVVEASDNSKKISSNNNVTKKKDESGSHTHSFTSKTYKDNGDGTHSIKCIGCNEYSSDTYNHTHTYNETEKYLECSCGNIEKPLTFTATGKSSVTIKDFNASADSSKLNTISYSIDNGNNWIKITMANYYDENKDNIGYQTWLSEIKNDYSEYVEVYEDEYIGCYDFENEKLNWDDEDSVDAFLCYLCDEKEIEVDWYAWDYAFTIDLNDGESVMFRGNNQNLFGVSFSMTGSIAASGSVTSLIDGKGVASNVTLTASCFSGMFKNCTALTSAPELPATTLKEACYRYMFKGCTELEKAPELPATKLAKDCYNEMFQDCSSLEKAPALPATTLADNCYACMFLNCTSLKSLTIPEGKTCALPATTLPNSCYAKMFGKTQLASNTTTDITKAETGVSYGIVFSGAKSFTGNSTNQQGQNIGGIFAKNNSEVDGFNSIILENGEDITWYWYIAE